MVSEPYNVFLKKALPVLQSDMRFFGVTVGGSWLSGQLDEYSDLDLVLVSDPHYTEQISLERREIAARMGQLLTAFVGEHVGEPRLLICLYDDPLLHVDLKFIGLHDLAQRIEDPVVLWERGGVVTSEIKRSAAVFPVPSLQTLEDRFWVFIHYAALKLGRGEIMELVGFLGFLREHVLGPLILMKNGHLPRGVRRIETCAKIDLSSLCETVASYSAQECAVALQAAIRLYRQLRDHHVAVRPTDLVFRKEAEKAATTYLEGVIQNLQFPNDR